MILLPVFWAVASALFRSDHAVSLGVIAPWYDVPVFDQILFFLADVSKDSAISYAKAILSNHDKISDAEFLFESAKTLLPSEMHQLLTAYINFSYYLPRAEMYRDSAKFLGGSNYPDLLFVQSDASFETPSEYPRFIRDKVELESFDLVIGNAKTVVYANLSSPKAAEYVLSLLNEEKPFVLRPTAKCGRFGVDLKGYGFELRPFKYSMEYGVKDNIITDASNTTEGLPEDEIVSSIEAPLYPLANHSEIKRFDLQLTSYVKSLGGMTPSLFAEITGNLPLHLPGIALSTPSNEEVPYKVDQDTLLINGRAVEAESADIFSVLKVIREESTVRNTLQFLGLNTSQIDDSCSTSLPRSRPILLKIPDRVISYLNDIEKDDIYNKYSTDIKDLFVEDTPPFVRKNLFNLILVGDGAKQSFTSMLSSVSHLAAKGSFLRIGVAPYFDLGRPLSRRVAFAYHHIFINNPRKAAQFLETAASIGAGYGATEEAYQIAYEQLREDDIKWEDVQKLMKESSAEWKSIQNSNSFLSVVRDGMYLNGKRVQGQNLGREVAGFTDALTSVLYEKGISSLDFDLFDLLSESYLVSDRISEIYDGKVESIPMSSLSMEEHMEFISFFEKCDWKGKGNSYVVLFSDDQNLSDDLSKIDNIMYAVNPANSELIRSIVSNNEPFALVNGRILRREQLSSPGALASAVLWTEHFTIRNIENLIGKQGFLVTAYLSAVHTSWGTRGQEHYPTPIIYDEQSSLFYQSSGKGISIHVIGDPVSKPLIRVAQLLDYLSSHGIAKVNLALLPSPEPPTVASFYRTALSSHKAVFRTLDDTTTYSSMPDVPFNWDIESVKATVDLDNIRLSDLKPACHEGVYSLEGIIVEGTLYNEGGEPFQGVFNVGDKQTLSMKTSGYWQVSLPPGKYKIDPSPLMPQSVTVAQFDPPRMKVRAAKSRFEFKTVKSQTGNLSRVDVFSIASGQLYERLMKIMMLSVRKNTDSDVTFWIVRGSLSPQFKASLPTFSKLHNFSYRFINYRWPRWLTAQTEKQRIVWGNKILFLDVMFPPSLERVIYVDADQIVRTDLVELMNMDFEGKPYAFVPFCESRVETEPFRFWKTGYWKNHLQNLPYHISALFAIDLRKFRESAAGDWLRYYYNQLSSDPSSLSNLDQDLPNYAQHQIPIYSLPNEWLWCETWCSDETMDKAKTIDLCNNPLTKVPKLKIALERVEEWPGLDEEARKVDAGINDYMEMKHLL